MIINQADTECALSMQRLCIRVDEIASNPPCSSIFDCKAYLPTCTHTPKPLMTHALVFNESSKTLKTNKARKTLSAKKLYGKTNAQILVQNTFIYLDEIG